MLPIPASLSGIFVFYSLQITMQLLMPVFEQSIGQLFHNERSFY